MRPSIEKAYGITKQTVPLKRVRTKSGRHLDLFENPGDINVNIDFPEFTCKCPRTGHPDFATITITYIPDKWCVELKSLKYFYNSFRDEGHFHEQVIHLIGKELVKVLDPSWFAIVGYFNRRGGTEPTVSMQYTKDSDGKGKWD